MRAYTTNRVPNMFVWVLRQETWLHRQLQRRVLRHAQRHAMQQFRQVYPRWADSLFDDFFLSHDAAPLLAGYLTTQRPTAAALATAWAAQSSPSQPHDLSEVTTIAAAFLDMLDAELAPYEVLLF